MKILFLASRASNEANTLPLPWYQGNSYSSSIFIIPVGHAYTQELLKQKQRPSLFFKHCSRFGGQWSEVTDHCPNCFQWIPDNSNMWSLYSMSLQSVWRDRSLKHLKEHGKQWVFRKEWDLTIGAADLPRWDLYRGYLFLEQWHESERKNKTFNGTNKVVQKPMLEKVEPTDSYRKS